MLEAFHFIAFTIQFYNKKILGVDPVVGLPSAMPHAQFMWICILSDVLCFLNMIIWMFQMGINSTNVKEKKYLLKILVSEKMVSLRTF